MSRTGWHPLQHPVPGEHEKLWEAHDGVRLLLQTRTSVLDGTLRDLFVTWHRGMAANDPQATDRAAA